MPGRPRTGDRSHTPPVSEAGGQAAGPEAEPRRGVLVVDDQADVRRTLGLALARLGYEVQLAESGEEALVLLGPHVDLVLLDANMPGLDGFEVARRIRAHPELGDIPIIMVTGRDSRDDRLHAVEAGCNDFIAKPFELTELQVRSASLLRMKNATDAIKRHRAELEEEVARRTDDLRRALAETAAAHRRTEDAHLDTIRRLILAAEYKDRDTAAHIERIGAYCALLARAVGCDPGEAEAIRYASQMHDVGKIGIPDAILLKPGKLDPDEWEIVKQHPAIGARILHGSPSPLLQAGEVIALTHHERWDGTGYPQGLAGDAIPQNGRLCSVADVFDALTTTRPYRKALPNEVVYEHMRGERGRHFDPDLLDAFFDYQRDVEVIQRDMRDD